MIRLHEARTQLVAALAAMEAAEEALLYRLRHGLSDEEADETTARKERDRLAVASAGVRNSLVALCNMGCSRELGLEVSNGE